MDKSKLIAIVALLAGIGFIVFSQQKPAPLPVGHSHDDGHDHGSHSANDGHDHNAPAFDVAGGITKLQTKDERKGTGTLAKMGDTVTVNYRGTLLNDKLFDESYGKQPFSFKLGAGEVIKGWDQGVAGMKVGGKRQLVIPASLGYGANGSGDRIPPGATLKFDVELLQVNGKG